GLLGLMKPANQRREDVRRLQIEIIVGAIQIRGHDADEIATMLAAKRLSQLDAGNFRDRIRLVRRLQFPVEKILLANRLRREPRINARASQKQQLANAVT